MSSKSIRMLVVDDYPDMCHLMAAMLGAEFEVVGSAADGAAAIVAAAALRPDAVLMDYQMPTMDGLAAATCIKQMPNAPQIVLYTSDDIEDVRARAYESGVDALLQKGCDFDLLRQTLWYVVASQQPTEQQAA